MIEPRKAKGAPRKRSRTRRDQPQAPGVRRDLPHGRPGRRGAGPEQGVVLAPDERELPGVSPTRRPAAPLPDGMRLQRQIRLPTRQESAANPAPARPRDPSGRARRRSWPTWGRPPRARPAASAHAARASAPRLPAMPLQDRQAGFARPTGPTTNRANARPRRPPGQEPAAGRPLAPGRHGRQFP